MFEFSNIEFETLLTVSKSLRSSMLALDTYFTRVQDDLHDEIDPQFFRIFFGHSLAIESQLDLLDGLLFSKEDCLPL